MPHLQRAMQIHRRLVDVEARAQSSSSALDLLAHGVILIDRSARIVFANRTAEEIVRARDGLTVHRRELVSTRANDMSALRTLIAKAVATSGDGGTDAGGLVLIGRPSGRAPLRVLVAPVADRHALMGSATAAACVFITDPERSVVPTARHLQRAFGFSGAETRVATALLDGDSVERVAERLCISRSTARTHLRRLFAKTDTARQADLIRLLLSVHPPVRFD